MWNSNFVQCGSVTASSTLSYVTASISAVMCLITVPGNLLICMAVYIDPYRRLRTPFNIVVANLAFADLIVGCITEPLSVYIHIKEGIRREITTVEVRAIHLSYFISCTASVLSISLLAVERYVSISYSFKYRLYFKKRRFVLVSLLVWLVAIGLSSVYILTSYVFYTFVFINIAVFWTLGVTTLCYLKILRKLKTAKEENVEESTVVGNTNAIRNVCPILALSKAYVLRVKENGVDNNGCNVNSRIDSIEKNIDKHDLGFFQVGESPCSSSDIEDCVMKINENVAGSSMNEEKCINNSESHAVGNANLNQERLYESDPIPPTQQNSHNKDACFPQLEHSRSPSSSIKDVVVKNNESAASSLKKKENGVDSNAVKSIYPVEETVHKIDSPPPEGPKTSSSSRTTSVETYNEYTSNKYNILVTKTYILVSLVFLACYIPALLIIYTMNWCQTCSCSAVHIMRDLQFIVVIVNSSVNPFLYSIRFAHFRRAISKILQDIRNEIFY